MLVPCARRTVIQNPRIVSLVTALTRRNCRENDLAKGRPAEVKVTSHHVRVSLRLFGIGQASRTYRPASPMLGAIGRGAPGLMLASPPRLDWRSPQLSHGASRRRYQR